MIIFLRLDITFSFFPTHYFQIHSKFSASLERLQSEYLGFKSIYPPNLRSDQDFFVKSDLKNGKKEGEKETVSNKKRLEKNKIRGTLVRLLWRAEAPGPLLAARPKPITYASGLA